jgi:phosphopantothenoylcysteine decarboxylase/phosphopantothenate--cysteine ligase
MTVGDNFLAAIEAYLEETGMSATRFGRDSVGDPRLVFDLRSRGRSPSADLMDRVTSFMTSSLNTGSGHPMRDTASASGQRRGPTILLIIGGGIAAYKSLDLIRRLRERSVRVRPVMTRAAREFITPLSVQALSGERVATDLFDSDHEHDVGHIRLAREADMIVAAPATADLMARLATGRADDLATAIILASRVPLLLAPAMNPAMWSKPATQRNLVTLRADGVHFIGPQSGEMAESGEAGRGRMAEPLEIVAAAQKLLAGSQAALADPEGVLAGSQATLVDPEGVLAGRHVVITSGPTHEPIDPVRYLANRSSGRQGHAIAAAAAAAGARVTLVSGPVSIPDPAGVEVVRVETARDMLAAVEAALPADVAIMAAAVADWRVEVFADGKIKKDGSGKPPSLPLVENPDILSTIGNRESGRPRLVVGFAAETSDLLVHGEGKRQRKGADWILANDVSIGSGVMGGEENQVFVISAGGVDPWPRMAKSEVATRLIALIGDTLKQGPES